MGVKEIVDRCHGDIWWVAWRYLIGVLDIFIRALEKFERRPADIW